MWWQLPVCALIAVLPAAAAVAVIYRRGKRPPRVAELWLPCWRKLSPLWLLGYRALVFLVMSWLLTQMVLIDGAFAFYFYTQWTFTLVIIYFVIGTVISAHGCWIYSRTGITESEEANGFLKGDLVNNNAPTSTVRADTYREDNRLSNRCEGKLHEKKAGFWGYVMQIIYLVITRILFLPSSQLLFHYDEAAAPLRRAIPLPLLASHATRLIFSWPFSSSPPPPPRTDRQLSEGFIEEESKVSFSIGSPDDAKAMKFLER